MQDSEFFMFSLGLSRMSLPNSLQVVVQLGVTVCQHDTTLWVKSAISKSKPSGSSRWQVDLLYKFVATEARGVVKAAGGSVRPNITRVIERLTEWNEHPGGFGKLVEKFFEKFYE